MEAIFKKLTLLTQTILSVFKVVLRSSKISNFHKSTDKSALILGNGPSLLSSLNELKNRAKFDLFCVNNFPNTAFYEQLKPEYYIIVSEQFFIEGVDREENRFRFDMIDSYVSKTTWPSIFFCPVTAKSYPQFLQRFERNERIEIRYFNTTPIEGFSSFKNFAMKFNLGSPRPHNVLIPSILIAINSGYKKLILFGADHSWLPQISVNENNEALINQKHFYDIGNSSSKQMRHKGHEARKLHEILEKFVHSFKAYFDLREYANSRQAHIYNATPDSFIDAFERKKISELE